MEEWLISSSVWEACSCIRCYPLTLWFMCMRTLWAQVWPYVKQLRQWVKQRRRQGGAGAASRAAAVQAPADPEFATKQQGPRADPVQEGAVTTHVQVSEC